MCFDNNNIRYLTSTVIGEWSRDKMCRYALLAGDGEPHIWDFGSAAKHHRLHAPWLPNACCHAGMVGLRGTVPPDVGLMKRAAEEIASCSSRRASPTCRSALDIVEPPMMFELQRLGIDVRDGQQVMLDAREIKNIDEIVLLNQAAAMVDGVYQMIWEDLKPGVREADIVARANKMLYEMGSDDVEAINAISGERCNPHPHNFTDRLVRPGDQAFFDIIQSYMGYRTCYYRTFNVGKATPAQHDAYKRCREWLDAAIELVRPGVTTDRIASVWPKAEEFGFSDEMEAFAPAVRPRHRRRAARAADHLAALLARAPGGDQGRHGVRAGDLLPGEGRVLGRAHRGGDGRHQGRAACHHAVPGRGAAHREPLLMAAARAKAKPAAKSNDDIGEKTRLALWRSQLLIREAREARLRPVPAEPGEGHQPFVAGPGGGRRRIRHRAERPTTGPSATYRGHAHTLARGAPVAGVLGELMGRDCGLMRGKGGSMHLTDAEHGMMGSYAIVGAHLPIAMGAAWSAQYRGTEQVSVCFFGDGTTNIGAFHEALNMAAVWKLPVVFVCENNLYMEYTPIGKVTAVANPAADRAGAYGLESIIVDGNDADAVYRTASAAVARRAQGRRPVADRGQDLPPFRPFARRPGQVPAGRGGEAVAGARPDPDVSHPPRRVRHRREEHREDRVRGAARRRRGDRDRESLAHPRDGPHLARRLCRRRVRMAELTYREAVAAGIAQEMARDERVVFLGEDVADAGGVFKATVGLLDKFGPKRVSDTPISEQAILGAAMGAAMTGLRPIAEIMFSDFLAVCWDLVANEMAKSRYMTNGQLECPLVIRTANGARLALRRAALAVGRELGDGGAGPQGRGAFDARRREGADRRRGARPRSGDLVRAQVALRREGRGAGRRACRQAGHGEDRAAGGGLHDPGARADGAARAGGGGERWKPSTASTACVIDVRSLVPLDTQTILAEIARTGRLFTVEENPRLCGWGAEIASIAAEECFYDLDAPIVRITTPHIPLPAADALEDATIPSAARIAETVRRNMG